jgi:hypothetical protein
VSGSNHDPDEALPRLRPWQRNLFDPGNLMAGKPSFCRLRLGFDAAPSEWGGVFISPANQSWVA